MKKTISISFLILSSFSILTSISTHAQSTYCLPPSYNSCTDSTTQADTDLVHNVYLGASMLGVQNWGFDLIASMPHWIQYYTKLYTNPGTVTSVASGYGLAGGPVTSSGTLKVDTTKVTTPYYVSTHSGTGTVTSVATGNGLTGGTITTSGTLRIDSSAGGTHTSTQYNVLHQLAIFTGASNINTLGTVSAGTWNGTAIGAQYGGTGQNSSSSTGVAQLSSGTWSFSAALANNTTATTQSVGDNSTKIATDAFVNQEGIDQTVLAYQALGSVIKAQSVGIKITELVSTTTFANQGFYLACIYIPYSMTITGIKWYQTTQGAYTATGYNGAALYSYSGGTLTLIDTSTRNGNIWKGTSDTYQSIAFSTTHTLNAGVYYIGLNYNESSQSTAPALACRTASVSNSVIDLDFTNSAFLFGFKSSVTIPPSSIAASAIGQTTVFVWLGLY